MQLQKGFAPSSSAVVQSRALAAKQQPSVCHASRRRLVVSNSVTVPTLPIPGVCQGTSVLGFDF